MADKKAEKFYVTTPIYYVNDKPHLGSLYTTVLADVVARWQKLLGKKTFFLTGTDEHGQKLAQAAELAGKTPKEFVDSIVPAYKDAWKVYNISYDHFIRTTDGYHVAAVQDWLKKLQEKGDIYKDSYQGWYCVPDEAYVTEKEAVGFTDPAKPGPACPLCGRSTTWMAEETYFFRLSNYQERLLAFYQEHPEFVVPRERFQEVISFVKGGLKDLSISRSTITWGIPFPGDTKHVTYVWADALNNYLTGVGYGQPGREKEFEFWWPADLQMMAKDIFRFHAIYWPAFLMASDLPLPKRLLVHGWLTVNGTKMSKSLGNKIDPLVLADQYGVDQVRYYLVKTLAITQDGDFSNADLEQKITSDLAHDLGNLFNRVLGLAQKNNTLAIQAPATWSADALALHDECLRMFVETSAQMEACMFHMALARIWQFIGQVNAYVHGHEPWKLAKTDPAAFNEVMSAACHGLRAVALLVWPVMPTKMEELCAALGIVFVPSVDAIDHDAIGTWNYLFVLKPIPPLFVQYEQPKPEEKKQPEVLVVESSVITIDEVAKVELVVGTIVECVAVEKSDKLLQMQVDFGVRGKRQILAGVKKFYQPEELIGQQAVFVYNLAPRKMMGLESHGMMLMAEDEQGRPHMTKPSGLVANGTRLR